jgi:21S rRNA (uridine2791-2'-O)-methyltransferase
VSTIQGNFLSESVREEVKRFLQDPDQGKTSEIRLQSTSERDTPVTEEELDNSSTGYFSEAKRTRVEDDAAPPTVRLTKKKAEEAKGRMVDVVLSDMCEPWEQTTGFYKRSLSDPYYRMMNTTGISFRDHAGSMVRVVVRNHYSQIANKLSGPVQRRIALRFRHASQWWPLCLQVLPGRRG